MSDSIGKKIRAARKDAHITQIQLAKRMGATGIFWLFFRKVKK